MTENIHCRQRAPVGIVLSSSGTSQLGMFDIQATTKSKYYDHIVFAILSIFFIDKTGSTEKLFLGPNRKVIADRAGTNVRK
jgi:hypothetical protein